MEKTQKSGEGVKTSAKLAEEEEKRRERLYRLEGNDNSARSHVPKAASRHPVTFHVFCRHDDRADRGRKHPTHERSLPAAQEVLRTQELDQSAEGNPTQTGGCSRDSSF